MSNLYQRVCTDDAAGIASALERFAKERSTRRDELDAPLHAFASFCRVGGFLVG